MLSLKTPAEPVFHADPENVAHIAQIAGDQIETAIGIVAPTHGHLLDPVAQAARNRQDLDVEHVRVDLLPAEEFLGHVVPEKLESALRVVDARQSDDGLHEPEEPARSHAPVERLRALDGDAFPAPRAD